MGPDHPEVAIDMNNLALLYDNQGKYEEAEPLYLRSLAIWEKTLPPDHPNIALILDNYASLLRKMNRTTKAAPMEERAREIRVKRSV